MPDMSLMFIFEAFDYNSATKKYNADDCAVSGITNISISFTDGVLIAINYTMDGEDFTLTFAYDNINLSVPTID